MVIPKRILKLNEKKSLRKKNENSVSVSYHSVITLAAASLNKTALHAVTMHIEGQRCALILLHGRRFGILVCNRRL